MSLNFFSEKPWFSNQEDNVCDTSLLSTSYPDSWTVLVDKGYQGVQKYVRAIIPKKKLLENYLLWMMKWLMSLWKWLHNCGNFLGCLTKLWVAISTKYRWTEEGYNDVFHLWVGLTNLHASYHLLCNEEDENHYNHYKNCYYFIVEKIAQKRKAGLKIVNNTVGTLAWTLASHLPHFHLIALIAARVFRGDCHVGQDEGCVVVQCVFVSCCCLVFFSCIKTFKFPTVVSKYLHKNYFLYVLYLHVVKRVFWNDLVNL